MGSPVVELAIFLIVDSLQKTIHNLINQDFYLQL